jgi:hypothetical protein
MSRRSVLNEKTARRAVAWLDTVPGTRKRQVVPNLCSCAAQPCGSALRQPLPVCYFALILVSSLGAGNEKAQIHQSNCRFSDRVVVRRAPWTSKAAMMAPPSVWLKIASTTDAN